MPCGARDRTPVIHPLTPPPPPPRPWFQARDLGWVPWNSGLVVTGREYSMAGRPIEEPTHQLFGLFVCLSVCTQIRKPVMRYLMITEGLEIKYKFCQFYIENCSWEALFCFLKEKSRQKGLYEPHYSGHLANSKEKWKKGHIWRNVGTIFCNLSHMLARNFPFKDIVEH